MYELNSKIHTQVFMYVYIIILYTIPFLPNTRTLIFQADSELRRSF